MARCVIPSVPGRRLPQWIINDGRCDYHHVTNHANHLWCPALAQRVHAINNLSFYHDMDHNWISYVQNFWNPEEDVPSFSITTSEIHHAQCHHNVPTAIIDILGNHHPEHGAEEKRNDYFRALCILLCRNSMSWPEAEAQTLEKEREKDIRRQMAHQIASQKPSS